MPYRAVQAAEWRTPSGTTKGLLSQDPEWGVGIQVGNYGATGLLAQKLGFYQGTLDLSLGSYKSSVALNIDYAAHFNPDFTRVELAGPNSLRLLRGKLAPFVGGGIQVSRGVSLRVPFGMGYVMRRDPVQFFGGLVFTMGPYLEDVDSDAALWFNLGVRIFL